MAHFPIGYQFAEDKIDGSLVTMLMQYFPTRDDVPQGKSIAHGTNQCAFIHFLKGIGHFDISNFDQQDFSNLSDYESYGSIVISPQGCTNEGPGCSLYLSGVFAPQEFYRYILGSMIASFRLHHMTCDVTEFTVGSPKFILNLAHDEGYDVRNNATITVHSLMNRKKFTPTKLSNLLYFS
jgi:hypothetical protein